MSWNYLPELEEAFSRNSFSDILQLARSRSRHIAAMFYFRDREISACRSSRSGTTSPRSGLTIPSAPPTSAGCDPSGASSASAEASLARISRLAARASASPEQNPGSGTRWRALSAEIQPAFVFAENSPMLATRGLGTVLESLAAMGYDARWCVLGADDLGYPIIRKRMWILGRHHSYNGKRYESRSQAGVRDPLHLWCDAEFPRLQDADVDRMLADGLALRASDGLAGSVEPVRAVGNGQVPAVAALAWRLLSGGLIREDNTAAMSIPDAA